MACSSSLYAAHGVLRRGKACLANARQLVAALGQASSLHTLAENSCPPFAQTQAKVGSPLGQDRLNLVGFSSLAAPAGAGDLRGFGSRTVLGRRGLSTSSTSAVESEEAAPGTVIEGDEPNIKYDKVQNEVSFRGLAPASARRRDRRPTDLRFSLFSNEPERDEDREPDSPALSDRSG